MRALLLFLIAGLSLARAQFYAPDAPGHDPAQALFPVEAARVLAWLKTTEKAPIDRIEYRVESGAEETAWTIRWLKSDGSALRERTVKYPAARLESGADFYRDTLRDLVGDDWKPGGAPPDNFAAAFWQGADLAGPLRAEGLSAAAKLVEKTPRLDRAADAARLAGVLLHAATPSLVEPSALDPALVARAAAWLAWSELLVRERHRAAWAPVLALAGRGEEARKAWAAVPARAASRQSSAERFWEALLRADDVRAVFRFAGDPRDEAFALPALLWASRADGASAAAARELILQNPRLERWHDYGGALAALLGEKAPEAVKRAPTFAQRAWQPLAQGATATALQPVAAFTSDDARDVAAESRSVRASSLAPRPAENAGKLALLTLARATRATTGALPEAKTAEEAWTQLDSLSDATLDDAASPEEAAERARQKAARVLERAEAFLKKWPDDKRRHDAELMALLASWQVRGRDPRADRTRLEAIRDAAETSDDARGEAEFALVSMTEWSPVEPHTVPPFLRQLSEYLQKYPRHARTDDVARLQLQILEQLDPPGADTLLDKLAAHPDQQIVVAAAAQRARRTKLAEFRARPLELKFTAADGRAVDLEKLRGKVVLLDFWASWCGPCMADAPGVAALYAKLRARGFEIIGISLDSDRAAMDAAIGKAGLAWPHFFDGKGWQNRFAQEFGIRAIPETWLLDKTGRLRQTGLRSKELPAQIERLLTEP